MVAPGPARPKIPYNSPEGRRILLEAVKDPDLLPFTPHDFSIEVAAQFLDQQDILVRTACGSGKTGTIALIAVLLAQIKKKPELAKHFDVWFPDNAAIVVICPTDALEVDIEAKMNKMKIPAVALNSIIIHRHQHNQNIDVLWEKVRTARIILMSPEMLESGVVRQRLGLDKDTSQSEFKARCVLLVCDEAHLVYIWGRAFRESFKNIGVMRVRLPMARLLLLTGTLQNGPALDFVLRCFGLEDRKFVDMHRSNVRPEIRVTTTVLNTNLNTAHEFPEFRWILRLFGITIIFCPDRQLAKRITLYLRRCYYHQGSADFERVRKWDATNDKESYDVETLKMVENLDPARERLVIVCTVILMVGMDFRHVRRILNIDCRDFDEELQKEGRLLRDKCNLYDIAESYVYVTKKIMKAAQEMVAAEEKNTSEGKEVDGKQNQALDIQYARRLVATCRTDVQNTVYNNPPLDQPPCSCPVCVTNRTPRHRTTRSPDSPRPCLCSGCQPGMCERDLRLLYLENALKACSEAVSMGLGVGEVVKEVAPGDNNDAEADDAAREEVEAMTSASQEIIERHLIELDKELFEEGTGNLGGLLTPGMFIPRPVIATIIDKFIPILKNGPERLTQELEDYDLDEAWLAAIWRKIGQKIYPDIKRYHEKRETEIQETEIEQKRSRLKKEVLDMSEEDADFLLQHEPILDVKDITTKLTKVELVWELRWHRLWNVDLEKPWKMKAKADFIPVLHGAVEQFHQQGNTVENTRKIFVIRQE
ncbi:hypothetical protein VNI00_016917 [Paramarasmius palmivorus]|uniref:Helicase ATP-binding domain-containing protein n=1 Tax=Paramarasmius palmivorus TaxID=297713 RepID=A0AAW0B9V3_9AGAR